MDLSIFPAVIILVMVLFNIPQGKDGGELSAQSFTRNRMVGVHGVLEDASPKNLGRNTFRTRLHEGEIEPKPGRSAFRAKAIAASVSENVKVGPALRADPPQRTMASARLTSLTDASSESSANVQSAFSRVSYPSLNSYSMEGPDRMLNDLDAKEDELNYKSIYGYIRNYYKRVPDQEADLIAKSLVEYGRKHDLDPKFAAAVMARESAFDRHAISRTGARGLGQIKSFNFPDLNIEDPHNIEQNTQGTVKYLKNMLGIWKDKSDSMSLALASYYKGQGAVRRSNGQLDSKTVGYVTDIMKNYDKLKLLKDDQK